MANDWTSSEGATQRVISLLNQAGIPHELRIAAICREFCAKYTKTGNPSAGTQKLVYSGPDEEYREVDQLLELYDEFEVDESTGIQLMLNVPIEGKRRSDVTYFAFPVPGRASHSAFPVVSPMAGSDYFRILTSTYQHIQSLPTAELTLVEIDESRTPKTVHKENLIYNAAAALYDFVSFSLSDYAAEVKDDPIITDLFREFQEYLARKNYVWWSSLKGWISDNVLPRARDFNQSFFGGHRVYHMVILHFPIVCVSGDLFSVHSNDHADIIGFEKIDACLAGIRKHKWPGPLRFTLLKRTSEVPVVVTNLSGLPSVLEVAANWYEAVRDVLMTAEAEIVKTWAIEAAFFQHTVLNCSTSEPDDHYRSDLDISQWL